MAFTTITITGGPFETPAGQPAQGQLTATLSEALTNGTEQIDPTPITGVINGSLYNNSGEQPFTLIANDDVGTLPVGSSYDFVIELDGAVVDQFTAAVPHTAAAGTIDLSVLA